MANVVQGTVTYHMHHRTEMGLEEFLRKFYPDNIIHIAVNVTLSDGSIHKMEACEVLEAEVTSFEVDGEEIIDEELRKEKITELKIVNSVNKIAV